MPTLTLAPLDEPRARAVATWRYPAPWDVYDMGPWERVIAEGWALGDPDGRGAELLAVLDASGAMIAYLRFGVQEGVRMLGVGLHPDRCGHGLGPPVVELGWQEHRRRHPGEPLLLEVRSWNTRAIRCYARAGFAPDGELTRVTALGPGHFVRMRRDR